jgi:hypothetical protein
MEKFQAGIRFVKDLRYAFSEGPISSTRRCGGVKLTV